MKRFLHRLGDASGLLGALVCLTTGLARLTRVTGGHWLLGFETGTLFLVGTALMVFGCFVKLHALTRLPDA